MKKLTLYTLILLSSMIAISSCSKDDDDQQENILIETFNYDGTEYEIIGAAVTQNFAFSFELEKEVISGFTLIFIEGEFYQNDIELISTDTKRGFFVEIDLEDYVEEWSEIDFETMIFENGEGAYFENITSFEDLQTWNGKEFGFPEELDEIELVQPTSLAFSQFELGTTNNKASLSCSFSFQLENGKLLTGTYNGEAILEK